MYENVRDVINSWDHDNQHNLVLMPSNPDNDTQLYTLSPPKQPEGGSWELYYSNKRGKWKKQFIILRKDGQLLYAKGNTEADICNLSGFDIYNIIPHLAKAVVKPPNKYCVGVKSQQQSRILENTTDFIHMFSTNDRNVADNFYRTVFTWRSWYLVNVANVLSVTTTLAVDNASKARREVEQKTGCARSLSEDSHFALGCTNELGIGLLVFPSSRGRMSQELARERSDNTSLSVVFRTAAVAAQEEKDSTQAMHVRKLNQRLAEKSTPPISYPTNMIDPSRNSNISSSSGSSALPRTSLNQASRKSKEAVWVNGLIERPRLLIQCG
jgi:hypothetical protein